MTATNQPFGFRPVTHPSGVTRLTTYIDGIQSGLGSSIYIGQPVKIASGLITPVTATSDPIDGIFGGCEYFDAQGNKRGGYFPSGATYLTGTMYASIINTEAAILEVQADGSVSATSRLTEVNTSNFAANNGLGQSSATVTAASVGSAQQGQWLILDVSPQQNNAWGDAYTVLRVKLARGYLEAVNPQR